MCIFHTSNYGITRYKDKSGVKWGLIFFQKCVSYPCFRVKTCKETDEKGKSEPRTTCFPGKQCTMVFKMGVSPQKPIEFLPLI